MVSRRLLNHPQSSMTLANQITIGRLLLVPVFGILALRYGRSVEAGAPDESLRWWALSVFVAASVSDGIDGWVARRFNQRSRFGAFMDPLADKALLLTALVVLTAVDWGPDDWRLPLWFAALVIGREAVILGGIAILQITNRHVRIAPHWTGKMCTFTLMFTLGWVMLKVVPFSPTWPSLVTAVFLVWSMVVYIREGARQLREGGLRLKAEE